MEYLNIEYISIITGFLLLLLGLFAILSQKNIIKIVIGFSLFDTGINIVMVSLGYIRNRTAPIIDSSVNANDIANQIVDPVPQALVLTAIVIGFGVTALMLTYVMRLYKEKKTLEIQNFTDLKW